MQRGSNVFVKVLEPKLINVRFKVQREAAIKTHEKILTIHLISKYLLWLFYQIIYLIFNRPKNLSYKLKCSYTLVNLFFIVILNVLILILYRNMAPGEIHMEDMLAGLYFDFII